MSASSYLARDRFADEGGSDAILDGEDGHGAAKLDGVIHRYFLTVSKK